ncbi:acetate--CoA ligase family protein [Sedimentitalea sp. JM2-8]|uniref:Acetate--CoA ligase family protein n=1 Tax=Sedimentitalea xiamensis TaxID=3050037 RepID=A0ABT7FIU3_9RHOB|nr:acetate--CoA ligase family protein [Sedimentitalea xiamensis]MDK3075054.1 acetate--CoA ligase family protein [Sedimentitalea xiamensis]
MTRDLGRLFNPRSIAVVGGGAWCAAIVGAARRIGYDGEIFPVHPEGKDIAGIRALRRLADWPGPIDAAFVGVNRHAAIGVVSELSRLSAGGAVCFASGFSESTAEDADASGLQAALVAAAGGMPVLGPNCYGFINALDRVAVWPDQHGMEPVDRGVAILTQSSNIAINLTMQTRGLPIAYMVTCGNMAQTSQAEAAMALLDDPRVTAIGLHIEGFGDLRGWEALAHKARAREVPLVAVKVGASEQARKATVSHTASLAGSDAGAQAVLDRLGIVRVRGLSDFLETLKLLHCVGRLPSNRIASISCSGGEASLIADLAMARNLEFPPLQAAQSQELARVLGPMVALANPLDYHTYVWRNAEAMAGVWTAMAGDEVALTMSIVDYPHTDARDWDCATEAAIAARARSGRPFAVVASLPELMPPDVARRLMAEGVVPMAGLDDALAAVAAAARPYRPETAPILLPGVAEPDTVLTEAEAKAALAEHGLRVPRSCIASDPDELRRAADRLCPPFAVKGLGLAHKSEHGAVRLGVAAQDVAAIAAEIGTGSFLVEEMIGDGVVELIVGVTRDPAHGFVLTLGAGGVLAELLQDTVSLLVPSSDAQVAAALSRLKCARLLSGYRGRPAADTGAILQAVNAIQSYVIANADTVSEVEVNPLICVPDRAIAVDALIRKAKTCPQ